MAFRADEMAAEDHANCVAKLKGAIVGLVLAISAKGIVGFLTGSDLSQISFLGQAGSNVVTKMFDLIAGLGGLFCAVVIAYTGLMLHLRPKKK